MPEARSLPPNFHSHEYGTIDAPPHFLLAPAYMALPFLRSPIGYGLVRPFTAFYRTVLLIVVPVVLEWLWEGLRPQRRDVLDGFPFLSAYAAAYLVLSLVLAARRSIGLNRAPPLHSQEAGHSWLVRFTTLPVPLCEILIIPGAVFLLGLVVRNTVSWELGWWWMITGLSLFGMGLWEFRRLRAQQRATTDDMMRAKTFEERVDKQDAGAKSGPQKDEPDFADLA